MRNINRLSIGSSVDAIDILTQKKQLILRPRFNAEIAFALGMLINSLCLCLLIKSSFGVSTLSSVPLVLSLIFTKLSLGTWTTIIQTLTVIILVLVTRQPRIGYLLSFAVGVVFGLMVDLFSPLINALPDGLPFQILYFIFGFTGMSFGAALFILCKLPIMPFDTFVRDFSFYTGMSVKKVKTIYDALSVGISLTLSFTFLHRMTGVGLGTILCIFLVGRLTQRFKQKLESRWDFKVTTKIGTWLAHTVEIHSAEPWR